MATLFALLVLLVIVSVFLAIVQQVLPDPVTQKWIRVVTLIALLFVLLSWYGGVFAFPNHPSFR